MQRVYLDKNILSYIRNPNIKNKDYQFHMLAKELIESNANKFLFFYSYAHILDLLEDKSEEYIESDLEYLEKITQNNYLIHWYKEKTTSYLICSPREAYEEAKEDNFFYDDIGNLDLIFNDLPPEHNALKEQFDALLDSPLFNLAIPNLNEIPEKDKSMLSKFLPQDGTLRSFMSQFKDLMKDFSNKESNAYKQFRSYTRNIKQVLDKYDVDYSKLDFNEDVFNSKLGDGFRQYLNKQINPDGNKEINELDYHTSAYNILEIFGIQHEEVEIKKNKNVFFNNTINDAFHSYYAAHCNIFVTNDRELYSKSKVLYRFLGIDTEIYTLQEFITKIPYLLNTEINDITSFLKSLSYDLNNGLIIKGKQYFDRIRNEQIIKPKYSYFSYFDTIKMISEEEIGSFVVLASEAKTYFKYTCYKSIEHVTNKLVSILGQDDLLNGTFQYNTEVEDILNNSWRGRKWTIANNIFSLEINIGSKSFCLISYRVQ